ncbi:MAG TPA: Vps62-related protein [Puia sp.]|nr:Vps62-related protein [Puia sp.]
MATIIATADTSSNFTSLAATNGEPTLLTSTTSIYTRIWWDKGSGASMDCTIYRPTPSDVRWFIVGDYAQGNNNGNPVGTSLLVLAVNDDSDNPLLKAPVKYEQIWNDRHSGGDEDGSIWRPIPPDGYKAMGCVGNQGHGAPTIDNYRCVRKDLLVDTTANDLIWWDKNSGAYGDVAVWKLFGVDGAFVAQGNYNAYTGGAYKLINS